MPENGRIFIDDLEGARPLRHGALPTRDAGIQPARGLAASAESRTGADRIRRRKSLQPAYTRFDVEETAGTILHYWFGYARSVRRRWKTA